MQKFTLQILDQRFSVCRLPGNSPVPAWAFEGGFWSVTRSEQEVSIVCESHRVPVGIKSEPGWKAFRVRGILEFSLTGVLSSLLEPLADAEISVFALSTFNTDYLLIKDEKVEDAREVLAPVCYFETVSGF
jgi:hypothetical protein